MKKTYITTLLILQLAAVLLLLMPMMDRVEPDTTTALHSAFQTLLTGNSYPTSYSFVDTIGLSMILNGVIFVLLALVLVSLVVLILRLMNKVVEHGSMIVTICSVGQSVLFAIYGILTSCMISTTLRQGNIHFYLKALLGSELYQSLDSIAGLDPDSVLNGLYGMPYYDYWGYLKVTPTYFIALLVLIVLACAAVIFHQKEQDIRSL